MENEWRDADAHEVTSREGRSGVASMELFFSSFNAFIKASAIEAGNRLSRVEAVTKVSFCFSRHVVIILIALRGTGRLARSRSGFRLMLILFVFAVDDRQVGRLVQPAGGQLPQGQA
jgi:hypothetical protein